MTIIQAALFLGEDVIVTMQDHTQTGNTGKLIQVQTHNWSVNGLVEQPLCTVIFEGGLELPFMPRHLEPVRQVHEKTTATA